MGGMSSANITSVTTTATPAPIASNLTIHGTGFGALQGTSLVFMFPTTTGIPATLAIVSWADTQIVATIADTASITPTAFVVVQIGGEQTGARSANFAVGPATPVPETSIGVGRFTTARSGALDIFSNPLPVVPPYSECFGIITSFVNPNYAIDWQTDTGGGTSSFTTAPGAFTLQGDVTTQHVTALGLGLPDQGG